MQKMKLLLLLALLAAPIHAETLTITLPAGTSASIPGTGPSTSVEQVVADWTQDKLLKIQRDDFLQASLAGAMLLPPARRTLILNAIQKISTTNQAGLNTINAAVNAAQ